ncbi:uncharacterized protein PG998_008672 [Apiospora kogelbergensis]|uniref:uncharacterized protein n=1 Tax=Apiospora kogelbergensis TaxID=1337665 RepID=UPI00312EA02C
MAIDPARAAETHLPRILGVSATFHILALILVACRVYSRACLVKSFGKDDALIITGAVCTLCGGMIILMVSGEHGLGRHRDTLSDDDYKMYSMLSWVQSLLVSSVGMAAIKVSVGASLLRLSTNRRFRQLVLGLIGFTAAYWALGFLSVVLYCQPIAGVWDPSMRARASCYPESAFIRFGFFNTACNIFTDVCFATAPLPLLWSLKLDRRVQLYLVVIFSLGYLAVAMAVAKAVCQAAFWADRDRTFDHWIQFFGFLEANVSLAAASLLPPVARAARRHQNPAQQQQRGDAQRPADSFDIEAELGLRGRRSTTTDTAGDVMNDDDDKNNINNNDNSNYSHHYNDSINTWDDVKGPQQVPVSHIRIHELSSVGSTLEAPSEFTDDGANGSRDCILQGDIYTARDDPIRIMKTTEVTISRD